MEGPSTSPEFRGIGLGDHGLGNDEEIGSHRGGYDPFSFNITDALSDKPEQKIVVRVWDLPLTHEFLYAELGHDAGPKLY